LAGRAYIAGAFEHPGRRLPDVSPAQLHAEVALGALADAGLTLADVDGFLSTPDAPGLGVITLADYLGLDRLSYTDTTETGGSAYIAHVGHAAMAIEAGLERVREEYAHVGRLDARIDPLPSYDDQAHALSYKVRIEEGKSYKFDALTITGLSPTAEKRLRDAWTIPQGELFDKTIFEEFLTKLETKPTDIFHNLPVHYENVGHWIQPDETNHTVNILLDFK